MILLRFFQIDLGLLNLPLFYMLYSSCPEVPPDGSPDTTLTDPYTSPARSPSCLEQGTIFNEQLIGKICVDLPKIPYFTYKDKIV
jgi:hypothetical protein